MLLFVDESGHDHREMPCEVLAGVAVSEDNLWNLVRAIRADECVRLAHTLLVKGRAAKGTPTNNPTFREIVAYSRKALEFVDAVFDVAAGFSVRIFASVVDRAAPRPENVLLRKDYVYLFERYFYFLETFAPTERGLVVFDELDKAQSHVLLQQMAAYFLGTRTGQYRSSRIVPEPFFVHSDLANGGLSGGPCGLHPGLGMAPCIHAAARTRGIAPTCNIVPATNRVNRHSIAQYQ